MYDAFYGLTLEPFRLSPDVRFCYRHRSFSKAKSYFTYALNQGEGFVLVTGRPGTGKTTLIEDILKDLVEAGILTVRVDSARLQADDLLRRVVYAFGLEGSGIDKATLLHRLEHYLHQRVKESGRALLIVDEAQTLSSEGLEELRLITNLTNYGQPLVQIFLVGQESLRDLISDPTLEQLHQRILCACHLDPLPLEEARDYLAHRLRCAGWRGDPAIDAGAIQTLQRGSGGIPRVINKLADRLLLHGALEEKHELTAKDAEYVLQELRTEMLLKEDLLSAVNIEEFEAQIEDIRLQPAPTGTATGGDHTATTELRPQEDANQEKSKPADTPVSASPDDSKGPHPSVEAAVEGPSIETQAPGSPNLGVTSEPSGIEEHNEFSLSTRGAIEPGFSNAGTSKNPAADLGSDAQSGTDASTRDSVPRGTPPGRVDQQSAAPLINKVPKGGPPPQHPKPVARRIDKGRAGTMLALLALLLGGGLLLLRDSGRQSMDGPTELFSNIHERLLSMAGRTTQDRTETVSAANPADRSPAAEASEPDSLENVGSVEPTVVAANAPLVNSHLTPQSGEVVDNTPREESSAPTPRSTESRSAPRTAESASVTRAIDTAAANAADPGTVETAPRDAVSSSAPDTTAEGSGDEMPWVSTATPLDTPPATDSSMDGPTPQPHRSGEPGPMEPLEPLEPLEAADQIADPDDKPAAIAIGARPVKEIPEPDDESAPASTNPPDRSMDDTAPTVDATTDESTPPEPATPADSPLQGVATATQALGIETEAIGLRQLRLILRKAVAFRFDSARVPAKSRALLDQLAAILAEHDAVHARIVGHTDHIGDAAYNRHLSARRAAAIEQHLISRGIAADRLSSAGMGEDEPLVPLEGEGLSREQRIANRRIEVWIEPIAAE